MLNKIASFFKGYAHIFFHGKPLDKVVSIFIVIAFVCFVANGIYQVTSPYATKGISTSEFVYQLENHNIQKISICNKDGSVVGSLWSPDDAGIINFNTTVPENSETFAKTYLESSDTVYDFEKKSGFETALGNIFMVILQVGLMVAALMWLFKSSGGIGNIMPFGKKDVEINAETSDVTFDDVAGIPEALEEMQEVVSFLKNPEVYDKAGANIPHGVLLQGSPGNGKTLLARALAGEAGVPFISASASGFIEMYVGVGAKRVRELFEAAKEHQPCILFIDEIDAIGTSRDSNIQTNDERIQTFNELLQQMDGFSSKGKDAPKIVIVGATNRGDALDSALLRPGRFDRIITVDVPAKEGRVEILQHYAQGRPFAGPVNFNTLASHTYGFSGAQLENVINQAATLAARRSAIDATEPLITSDDLEEGIARTIAGPALKSKQMTESEKKRVAYHEAGHAVVQYQLPGCDNVQRISIVSRAMTGGIAGGYVQSYSEEDKYFHTADDIHSEIAALMAGKAAEKMFCGNDSTGADNDLSKASKLAYEMIDRFAFETDGNDSSLRVKVRDGKSMMLKSGDNRLNYIDEKVEAILQMDMGTAKRILSSNSQRVEHVVSILLEEETIEASRIAEIMEEPLEEEANVSE